MRPGKQHVGIGTRECSGEAAGCSSCFQRSDGSVSGFVANEDDECSDVPGRVDVPQDVRE